MADRYIFVFTLIRLKVTKSDRLFYSKNARSLFQEPITSMTLVRPVKVRSRSPSVVKVEKSKNATSSSPKIMQPVLTRTAQGNQNQTDESSLELSAISRSSKVNVLYLLIDKIK